jgi:hypothetical protein
VETDRRMSSQDGRTLADLALGDPGGAPVLCLQGVPNCGIPVPVPLTVLALLFEWVAGHASGTPQGTSAMTSGVSMSHSCQARMAPRQVAEQRRFLR